MITNVYDSTSAPDVLKIAGSVTSPSNINIVKYFNILNSEAITPAKVTRAIHGSYRAKLEGSFVDTHKKISSDVEEAVKLLFDKLNQSSPTTLVDPLRDTMEDILKSEPSGAVVAFLEMLDNEMIYSIALLTRNLINFEITLDNFVEDWAECKQILESKGLFNHVICELNNIVYDMIVSFANDGLKLDIVELEDGVFMVFTLTLAQDVVFTNGIFNLMRFKVPGVVTIDPSKSEWATLSSITNKTGLSYYKLYNNNYSRFDNCITVYLCKVTNTFLLYI